MTVMYAQGDLLIERVDDVCPSGTIVPPEASGATVVAEGELTGHRHSIFDIIDDKDGNNTALFYPIQDILWKL